MEAIKLDSFTATNKILENLKLKYRHLDNIMNLTKDMERAMMANDSISFGKILDMRGDVMILVDKVDAANKEICKRLPSPLREKISAIIIPKKDKTRETLSLENPLETNIYDTNLRISTLLTRIIKLDGDINQRVKGQRTSGRLNNMRG